jgi:tRNA pseudouridine55 synthase
VRRHVLPVLQVPLMTGVLVVDKPQGLTSHDVVAIARRALGEARIGHTGTLDPLATGILALACGRATRLVRFLTAADKDYEATIRFGLTTDSYDITGTQLSRSEQEPDRDAVIRALVTLSGEYLQMPPAHSAKKIAGRRAYEMARRQEPVTLTAVAVRVAYAELLSFAGSSARVAIRCSAGFYVRSFAQMLGELVGTGACLEALRRTRSGAFDLASAVSLEEVRRRGPATVDRIIPLERLLEDFPCARLTREGCLRVSHGQEIEADVLPGLSAAEPGTPRADTGSTRMAGAGHIWVRLLDDEGHLLALGTPGTRAGSLHPAVVLI